MPMLIQAHLIDLKLKIYYYYIVCKCIVTFLLYSLFFGIDFKKYFVCSKSVTTIYILTCLNLLILMY